MTENTLYRVASVQALEANQSLLTLGHWMQDAANGVMQQVIEQTEHLSHVGIVTGSGNNAGDGFLVACLLKQQGIDVTLYPAVSDEELPPLAKQAAKEARQLQIPRESIQNISQAPVTLWVDAIFGIGLNRPLSEPWVALIDALNQHPGFIMSVDVPSGLNADTGKPWNACVKANHVVMVGVPKLGLYTTEAKIYAQTLTHHPIEKMLATATTPDACRIPWCELKAQWPMRAADAHKGNVGTVHAVGGQTEMAGAIILAAKAALKTGVGTLHVWTDPEHATMMNVQYPQWRTHPFEMSLPKICQLDDVLLIGPGLGQSRVSQKIYQSLISAPQRTILDADALSYLAKKPRALSHHILTPHPKEAALLLGRAVDEIQSDRWQAVRDLAQKYDCVVLLKGAGTWVAAPDKMPWLCPHGNSAMAVGGMGDVLSGIIAAIWAQGSDAFEAACLGVALHAQSADEQVKYYRYGLSPLNVIEGIRLCLPDVTG